MDRIGERAGLQVRSIRTEIYSIHRIIPCMHKRMSSSHAGDGGVELNPLTEMYNVVQNQLANYKREMITTSNVRAIKWFIMSK